MEKKVASDVGDVGDVGSGDGAGAGAGAGADTPTSSNNDAWIGSILDSASIKQLAEHAAACSTKGTNPDDDDDDPPSPPLDVARLGIAIGRRLLQDCHLLIAGARYKLVEVECYINTGASPVHADPFAHGHADQKLVGWYFHKVGKGYKGGSYKGLDIAFGAPGVACGYLIRAIQPVAAGGKLVQGSCRVVEHILAATKKGSIPSLVETFDRAPPKLNQAGSLLQLVPRPKGPAAASAIYSTPRVGLSLKKARDGMTHATYFSRPYRLLTDPSIKTGREYTVVSLHAGHRGAGVPTSRIANLTNVREDTAGRYVAAFDKGRSVKSPSSYFGVALSTSDRIEALGACWKASQLEDESED